MTDILLLAIPALTNQEVRNAIADTQACLEEPLSDDEREKELGLLSALIADCRRRGIDPS